MDCNVVRPLASLLNTPSLWAFFSYTLKTTHRGIKAKGWTIAKTPNPQRHPDVSIKEVTANGAVKAVQMNGVVEKAKAQALLRSPVVSAMKISKMR